MGWLPQDVNEANQLRKLGEIYWASRKEVQVLLLATATSPKCWVDVPTLVVHAELLVDTYDSLGHCRWEKLLSALCGSY